MTRIVPVIMSGGSGTRLWPLSRTAHPKQLHALVSDRTMLQETVRRVSGADEHYRFEPPIVVLNERQCDLARSQLEAMDAGAVRLVVEPVGRNTAPVAAVAAELVRREHGEDTLILLLPADHHIRDAAGFRAAVATGAGLAENGHIITFGIQPERPETGYGYIRRGEPLDGGYRVRAFTEKPDLERARGFLADGGYYWNAGIFLFGAGHLAAEMSKHCPDVLTASRAAVEAAAGDRSTLRLDAAAFSACPSISFDYAVMERTENAAVVPADIGWSDVGAWDALWAIGERDAAGVVTIGDVVAENVADSYLRSEGPLVAAVGVRDLIVVATNDAVLVAPKHEAQAVKTIVERLRVARRPEAETGALTYRPWGSYQCIDLGDRFQVKRIVVKPGRKLSLQMHHHRAEHWIVVSGTAEVTCGDKTFLLHENQSTYISQGAVHRLGNPGKIPLHLIEVQSGGYLGEDDIVRIADEFGRT